MRIRFILVCFAIILGLVAGFTMLSGVQASRSLLTMDNKIQDQLASHYAFSRIGTANNFRDPTPVPQGEGPYEPDDHTLLLVHFDGDYSGVHGETATVSGTTFVDGFFNQGVLIDDGDSLTYTTLSNLSGTLGMIEFWLQPTWQGDDGQIHILFETGPNADSGVQIGKDGIGMLHFMIWDHADQSDVVYDISDWQAGDWHHVLASWQDQKMVMLVDGQRTAILNTVGSLQGLGTSIYIGSSPYLGWWADAVLDELRIRDYPVEELWLPLVNR